MKKVFLSLLLVSSIYMSFAQNYNGVKLNLTLGKVEEAKKEMDKVIADPKAKDKVETDFWAFAVNGSVYGDSVLKQKYPGSEKLALESLTKYAAKEPDLKKLKTDEEYKDFGLRALSNLYGQSFNEGRAAFQSKDWANSFNSFAFCQQVSEFIGKNTLTTNGKYTIDTTVVLYAAYAAQNAGKPADAAVRYKSLADWKINDTAFQDIYKFILDYDTKQKDEASFKKYLAVAKEVFPADAPVWNQFEMNYMSSNAGINDIVTKYKSEDAAGKLNEDGYITYAESFATPDKTQADQLDSTQKVELKMTASDAFQKAYNLNNKAGIYAFNAGVLYYSIFGELDDRFYNYRGESAALKAKREEILKQQFDIATKAIEWLEKGYTALKAKEPREKSESQSLNRSVDYLANLYLWKRDRSKIVDPKSYDALDAKYKLFDSEHDKYKN
jgi:hypothetical protein